MLLRRAEEALGATDDFVSRGNIQSAYGRIASAAREITIQAVGVFRAGHRRIPPGQPERSATGAHALNLAFRQAPAGPEAARRSSTGPPPPAVPRATMPRRPRTGSANSACTSSTSVPRRALTSKRPWPSTSPPEPPRNRRRAHQSRLAAPGRGRSGVRCRRRRPRPSPTARRNPTISSWRAPVRCSRIVENTAVGGTGGRSFACIVKLPKLSPARP